MPTASGPIESARVVSRVTSRIDGRGEVVAGRLDGVSRWHAPERRTTAERVKRVIVLRVIAGSSNTTNGPRDDSLHYNRRHAELHLVRPYGDSTHRGDLHGERRRPDKSIGRFGED